MPTTLTATIDLNYAPFARVLKLVEKDSTDTAQKVQDVFANVSVAPDTSTGAAAFNALRNAASATITEQKSALAAMIASGRGSGEAFDKAKSELLESVQAARQLDNALEQVNKEIDDAGSKKISIGDQLKSGLSEGLSSGVLGGIIGGGVAGVVTQGVAALGEGLKAVVEIGQEYEQSMAGLSAVTGVTGAGLDDLGNRARGLAKQFGGEATTQLSAFQGILSKFGPQLAGFPEQLSAVSTNVNLLAKAGGLNAQEAMSALADSMLQFGVDVENADEAARESSRFINVLAASAQVGAAEIPQVAQAVLAAGVAAKGANVSFEETNAALQVLAVGGKVGSEAGVALRNVLGLLQKQSGEGEKQLNKLGLSVSGLGQTLTTKGLGAALAELKGGINTLGTDAQKNAALMQLFGTENASAAGILLNGTQALDEFTKGVTGTNAAVDQASVNMNTFGERMSRLQASIQDIAIGVFQTLAPIVNALFDALSTAFGVLTTTLGPVFSKLFGVVGGFFERLWSIAKPILIGLGAVIVANLVASLTTVATILTTVYDVASRVFDALMRALKPLGDAFSSVFGSIGKGADPVKLFTGALEVLTTIITETGSVLAELLGTVIEFGITGLQFILKPLGEIVKLFGSQNKESRDVKKNTEAMKSPLETIRGVFDNMKGTLSGITSAFREVKEVIFEFFSSLKNLDFDAIGALFSKLGERIKGAYDRGFNDVVKKAQEARAAAAAAAEDEKKLVAPQEAAAEAAERSKEAKKTDLQLAKEAFQIRQAQLKNDLEIYSTQLLQKQLAGEISKEAAAVELDRKRVAIQKELAQAFTSALSLSADAEGRIVSIGVRIDAEKDGDTRKVLTDLTAEYQSILQAGLNAELKLSAAIDPKDFLDSAKTVIKSVGETFKESAADLANGLIDKDAFEEASKGLQGSLEAQLALLQEQLNRPVVAGDSKLKKSFEDMVTEIKERIASLPKETSDAIRKAEQEALKVRLDLNKQNLDLLKSDEKKNRDEIVRILIENVELEKQIRLASIKTIGALRDEETRIIIANADRQLKDIEKRYAAELTFAQRAEQSIVDFFNNALASRNEADAKAREERIKAIDSETDALKKSVADQTLSLEQFNEKMEDLRARRAAEGEKQSILETVFGKLKTDGLKFASTELQRFTDSQLERFSKFQEQGLSAMEALGAGGIALIGGSFTKMIADGELSAKKFLSIMLDTLESMIPIITAQLFGLYASSPNVVNILGLGVPGVIAAGATALAFKGLVAVARAAVGAEAGVVGFTRSYNKAPGPTDRYPIMIAEDESVMTKAATRSNRELFEWSNKTGGSIRQKVLADLNVDTVLKEVSRDLLAKALNFKELGIVFTQAMASPRMRFEPRIQIVERDNKVLVEEIRRLRADVRNLEGRVQTEQTVHLYPHINEKSVLDKVDIAMHERKRGF